MTHQNPLIGKRVLVTHRHNTLLPGSISGHSIGTIDDTSGSMDQILVRWLCRPNGFASRPTTWVAVDSIEIVQTTPLADWLKEKIDAG